MQCRLLSDKAPDAQDRGNVSNLLAALAHLQKVNGNGKLLQVHGVNISIGHGFDPEWFACGQSPLCVEMGWLVPSGVVVVVAAGNTGYGTVSSKLLGPVATTLALTINDPGNAELAITVGVAHRESPHQYGISYFSSKGPTGDGRRRDTGWATTKGLDPVRRGPHRVSGDPCVRHDPSPQYRDTEG
ncbi:hypothetical protein GCM10008939_23230 [Deinococcus aquiradiocola]|uniref:Peptidase S8/S53 domain-containing protein n=2 Tax=Deinococcus aquiradiocola TaxID=393059 RepID=A0A917URB2_9DEIO|nr:hypothetical protein GCM10008939_23230 [Deinococcus aquiradiocola]